MDKRIPLLLERLYGAVSEPAEWNGFLEYLAQDFNSHAIRLRVMDKTNQQYSLLKGYGHDADFDSDYRQRFISLDPWNPILERATAGTVILSHQNISDECLGNSVIYNDLYRKYDVFYCMGSNLINSNKMLARIGIHRPRSCGVYSQKEQQLLQQLMPHLIRSYQLQNQLMKLNQQRDSFVNAFYQAPQAQLLLNEFGQVVFVNKQAEKQLDQLSSILLKSKFLTLCSSSEQSNLNELIRSSIETATQYTGNSGGSLRVHDSQGRHQLNLIISPYALPEMEKIGLPEYIYASIFIHDIKGFCQLPSEILRSLYNITPAENRLAAMITDGQSLSEVAANLGLSIHTIRSQLKSLFNKTNTNKQTELVHLLYGLSGLG